MKTITLLTLGAETDVHHMLALGARLQQQGRHVRLAAAPEFQPLAKKLGLCFQPIEVPAKIKNRKSNIKPHKSGTLLRQIRQLAETSSLMAIHQPYPALLPALGPLPCPVMGVALQAEEAFASLEDKKGLLSRLASRIRGRRPRAGSCLPTLYNFSPQLLAGGENAASALRFTGQWAIPDSLQWILSGRGPSPALGDWLFRGGRPVFFDFSQAPESECSYLRNLVEGLSEKMGFRAILCTGWADYKEGVLRRDIYHVKSPVQEWLFGQCAAVVHYRNCEKLPAAIRAGVPGILFASGQEAKNWGKILAGKGIGIHRSEEPPTAASLEAALEEALRLSMQYKARMMGKALQEEDGLAHAVRVIGEQVEEEMVAKAV